MRTLAVAAATVGDAIGGAISRSHGRESAVRREGGRLAVLSKLWLGCRQHTELQSCMYGDVQPR